MGMADKGSKGQQSRRAAAKRTQERRRYARLRLGIPVFARGIDSQGKEFLEFTTTLNISAGGALLVTRRYLPADSKLFLEIPSAPLPRVSTSPQIARTLETHITRVTPSEPSYLCAVQFDQEIASA